MKIIYFSLLLPSFFSSCTNPIAVSQQNKHEYVSTLNDLRYEIADLKHALNNAQVEIQILDEQVRSQSSSLPKPKGTSAGDSFLLEKKIAQIESQQKKIADELKNLSTHANQTSQYFNEYKTKLAALESGLQQQGGILAQIAELKSNLLGLDQEETRSRIYTVKPGDSLDKIAKIYKITIKDLKELNRLSHDKIRVGQELKIPSSD